MLPESNRCRNRRRAEVEKAVSQCMAVRPPSLKTQPPQLLGVALPLLGDLDLQVEEARRTENPLDLHPRGAADLPQSRTVLPDDDAFLAVAFDENVGAYVHQRLVVGPVGAGHHFIDHYRNGMRKFIAHALQL